MKPSGMQFLEVIAVWWTVGVMQGQVWLQVALPSGYAGMWVGNSNKINYACVGMMVLLGVNTCQSVGLGAAVYTCRH
jgi:hypothetical protein